LRTAYSASSRASPFVSFFDVAVFLRRLCFCRSSPAPARSAVIKGFCAAAMRASHCFLCRLSVRSPVGSAAGAAGDPSERFRLAMSGKRACVSVIACLVRVWRFWPDGNFLGRRGASLIDRPRSWSVQSLYITAIPVLGHRQSCISTLLKLESLSLL
jgi:hypothetical protein